MTLEIERTDWLIKLSSGAEAAPAVGRVSSPDV